MLARISPHQLHQLHQPPVGFCAMRRHDGRARWGHLRCYAGRRVQVGNVQEERQEWRRPEDVTRFAGMQYDVGFMLLDESPSDLAGQVVAAITAGAIALQQYDVIDRTVAKNMVRPPRPTRQPHPPQRALCPQPGVTASATCRSTQHATLP